MNIVVNGDSSLDSPEPRTDKARHSAPTGSQVEAGAEQVRPIALELELQTREPRMCEAVEAAFRAASSEATILLRGESGAGKETLARAIHARSPRAAHPLVTLHCQGLSVDVLDRGAVWARG